MRSGMGALGILVVLGLIGAAAMYGPSLLAAYTAGELGEKNIGELMRDSSSSSDSTSVQAECKDLGQTINEEYCSSCSGECRLDDYNGGTTVTVNGNEYDCVRQGYMTNICPA